MDYNWKNGSHLEKWVTLGIMVSLAIMGNIRKNGSHLQKWVTLGKIDHTWKSSSLLEKWVIFGNMGHT